MGDILKFPPKSNPSTMREVMKGAWEGKKIAYWYHPCPKEHYFPVEMVRGFSCKCGARADDHELGPYLNESEMKNETP